jgi:hypothetical protein
MGASVRVRAEAGAVRPGSDGFGSALLAEWTKLRTVRRWTLTLFGAAVLIVAISMLGASSSSTDVNKHPNFVVGPAGQPVSDEFEFVYQSLTGDGTVTARVTMQQDSGTRPSAGLVVKDGLTSGSRYVSVAVTPKDGVHLRADYHTDIRGSAHTAPVWLRLTRAGDTVTAEESADGQHWKRVGQVKAGALPREAQIGLFVASPRRLVVQRGPGSTSVGEVQAFSTASFDNVGVTGSSSGAWIADTVHMPREQLNNPNDPKDPKGSNDNPGRGTAQDGDGPGFTRAGDVFTIKGGGKVGPDAPDDDVVSTALFGVLAGLMAVVAVAVLYVTAEYRRGMIRTTFAAMPRRGRTLAAKAVVIGAAAFVVGVVGGAVALLAVERPLRKHGFGPPAFPDYSLTDWPVLRALLLTSVFLALLSIFALALGAIVRHSATAITAVIMLVVLPVVLASVLPFGVARWIMRLTPAGGLATWRAKPPATTLSEPWAMLTPATGLAIVGTYAAVTLVLAWWLVRRRDA